MIAIHLNMLWSRSQLSHRPPHGKQTGLKYIDTVYLLNLRTPQSPAQRPLLNQFTQSLAAFGGEFFGISQPVDRTIRRKDDSSSYHRTRQWPAPYLIDTGNEKRRNIFIMLKIHEVQDIRKAGINKTVLLRPGVFSSTCCSTG